MSETAGFSGNTRFLVLSHLGTGGMGVVYEALDRERNMRVAIKTLRLQQAAQLLRFKHEFRALRDIRHPNLVELGELFEEDGSWFFTMELVEGVDFRDYIRGRRRDDSDGSSADSERLAAGSGDGATQLDGDATEVSSDDAAEETTDVAPQSLDMSPHEATDLSVDEWVFQDDVVFELGANERSPDAADGRSPDSADGRSPDAADGEFDEERLRSALKGLGAGLVALHRAGKVHCDVKPSNVMVTPRGRVVVLDFGVVTEVDGTSYSRRKVIAGSPAYMSPEQAGGGDVGPAADWYGVGVLLFEALTGRLPFSAGSPAEVVAVKQFNPAPHPSEFAPDLPRDLASLCSRLLATDSAERPPEDEILAILGIDEEHTWATGSDLHVTRSSAFVGRKAELAALQDAYLSSRLGQPVSVFVEGESGVGKSALIEHYIALLLAEPNTVVFRGQCHEREFVPYNAFDGVVDDMGRYLRARYRRTELPGDPAGIAPLLHIFPVLSSVPCLARHAREERIPGDQRSPAFAALREILTWIADRCILVIVIHDVHWADADSLMLLGELMSLRTECPLLFLATARKLDDGSSCMATRSVSGDARHIELVGLRDDEAEELAHRLFERLPGGVIGDIDSVVAETGGHPMFMDELVRHLAANARGGESVHAAGAHLDDALRSRVAGLTPQSRDLLETIVVAGAPLAHKVIAQAAGLMPDEFVTQLAVLRDANLIRVSGVGQRASVGAYHDRIREAVSEDLRPDRIRALHGRLSEALEFHGAESIRLAVHYFHAGELNKSAEHAIIAARRSAQVFAFDQAAELYSMAIVAGKRSREDQCQLLTELGMALQNAGRSREAAEAYTAAAEWADQAAIVELHRRAAEQLLTGGYMEEGIDAISAVLGYVGMSLPKSNRTAFVSVLWNLARLRMSKLTWRSRPEHELPREELNKVDVCWSAGTGLSLVDTARAMVFGTRATWLSLKLGEPFRIARSTCMASVAASALGDSASALRMMDAAQRASAETGRADAQFFVEVCRFTYSFFFEHKWRQCIHSRHELERMYHAFGKGRGFEIDFAVQFSTWAMAMLGDPRQLTIHVDQLIRDAERIGNRLLEINLRVCHGLRHLAIDDPETALQDITDAVNSWLPGRDMIQLPHVWALCGQVDIALYRGDAAPHAEFEQRFDHLRRSAVWTTTWIRGHGQFSQGRLALARAALARQSGDRTLVRDQLKRATRMAEKLEAYVSPLQPLWGAILRAGIAHLHGTDAATVVAHLRRAHAGLESTETLLHAMSVKLRLGQIIGGREGKLMEDDARSWMHSHGVVRPSLITGMIVPGW